MKKEKVLKILKTFEQMYPDATCELNHSSELELLIAVVLSAQTTDKSVNQLTATLFQKYRTLEDYATAPLEQLQEDLKTIGLYRSKAKSIKGLAEALITRFNGSVPRSHKELLTLPGVGRKTANVVTAVAYQQPAFAVDTHVERISKRLGFAQKKDSVLVVEKKLMKNIPKEYWIKAHHQFIFFGRYFCKAVSPDCGHCPLFDECKDQIKNQKKS